MLSSILWTLIVSFLFAGMDSPSWRTREICHNNLRILNNEYNLMSYMHLSKNASLEARKRTEYIIASYNNPRPNLSRLLKDETFPRITSVIYELDNDWRKCFDSAHYMGTEMGIDWGMPKCAWVESPAGASRLATMEYIKVLQKKGWDRKKIVNLLDFMCELEHNERSYFPQVPPVYCWP